MSTSEHIKSGATWMRGLYILLFAALYSIAEVVLGAIVLYQFGSQLLTGGPNRRLLEFTRGMNAYIYQILQFITFRSDEHPFPFADWPAEGLPDEEEPLEDDVSDEYGDEAEEETDTAEDEEDTLPEETREADMPEDEDEKR